MTLFPTDLSKFPFQHTQEEDRSGIVFPKIKFSFLHIHWQLFIPLKYPLQTCFLMKQTNLENLSYWKTNNKIDGKGESLEIPGVVYLAQYVWLQREAILFWLSGVLCHMLHLIFFSHRLDIRIINFSLSLSHFCLKT